MEDEIKIDNNNNNEQQLQILTILYDAYLVKSNENIFPLEKNNYELIIDYINKNDDQNIIPFFNYLNDLGIPILELLIEGYIKFDFEDENQSQIIKNNISRLIKIYFNKNIFHFVYNKLSKIYRKQSKFKDIKTIKKFEKIFDIWKFLYNIENNSPEYVYDEQKKNKNFEISIKKEFFGENSFIIELHFINSKILNKLKLTDDFFFLNLYTDNHKKISFSYLNIFNLNSAELIKESNKLVFNFNQNEYSIFINDTKIQSKKHKFNLSDITSIKIYNYFFFGEIYQINIQRKNMNTSENSQDFKIINKILDVQISKKNYSDIYDHKFFLKVVEDKEEKFIHVNNLINFEQIGFRNKRNWFGRKKRLESINYYGGIKSFIPLFKIIKNIINYIATNELRNEKEYIDYLSKTILWIKDIIKNILILNVLSEKNYLNFKSVIIQLIGALAEITHIINKLVSENLINIEVKNSLFTDEIIYSLFIAIIGCRLNKNSIFMFKQMFELEEKWKVKFTLNYFLFDIKYIKDLHYYWYFSSLSNYALFILLYNDSLDNCPKAIIEQMEKMIMNKNFNKNQSVYNFVLTGNNFLNLIKGLYSENNNQDIFKIKYSYEILKSNSFFLKLLVNLMKTILNVRFLSKINQVCFNNNNSFIIKIIEILNANIIILDKKDNEFNELYNIFYYYYEDFAQLKQWFSFLKDEKFLQSKELLINELVDYHGEYHKKMKELFLFNQFWSDEKLFCNQYKKDFSYVKYKNINYYTRNFQRPIIYPILDYMHRYPEFSQYKMNDDFYLSKENDKANKKYDYNFDLFCPEFDEYLKKYTIDVYNLLRQSTIKIYNVCLVKQAYHIKGQLFLLRKKHNFKIIFFSYLYDFNNKTDSFDKCNKSNNANIPNFAGDKKTKDLCYGQLFKCSEKEKNRKKEITLKNIRMILNRIYYYRKSAVEIFTQTKSYFFNFFSIEEFNNFSTMINDFFDKDKIKPEIIENDHLFYMPINFNNNRIGYLKTNKKYIKYDFIEFLMENYELNNICIFDIIMLLNLISNRSYSDFNQYPVFPVLFFYDKNKKYFERDLKSHIGFQTQTEGGQKRYELILKNFISNQTEKEYEEDGDLYYFNTHYSNIVYINNFMARIFPYTFCTLEIQGKSFDAPNRLFFSLDLTLNNITSQVSDLRELTPEFFYLPEMFENINYINFGIKKDGQRVDDVEMPEELSIEKYINNNNMTNIINKDNIIEDSLNYSKKINFLKIFLFLLKQKNKLETSSEGIYFWINLIFGKNQKYAKKKTGQFFRSESYIDKDDETLRKYANDNYIVKSVDFGLIPLQVIFEYKSLNAIKSKKFPYEKTLKNKKANKKVPEFNMNTNELEVFQDWTNKDDEYWDENININFKIENFSGIGKIKITADGSSYDITDHYDEIIDYFYNKRLNMFATYSYDGYVCIYIVPNKLISIIKHPGKLYYDKVFLSANPYPIIITYEKLENKFSCYSLRGMLINSIKFDKVKINIILHFDIYGGCYKDRIEIYNKKTKLSKLFDLPFFDEVI